MSYRYPDIYEILDAMTLKEKEKLCEELQNMIEAERQAPKGSYLEEQWGEILRLIAKLKLERYIDDQNEIYDVWKIVEKMIKSGKLELETWKVRERVLKDIIEEDYYNDYGVYDPMRDLLHVLLLTPEEKLKCADMAFKSGYGLVRTDVLHYYKDYGREDRYYQIIEYNLSYKKEPYLELIQYYKDKNADKAVSIANLGLKKCREGQTDFIIYLLHHAAENGDDKEYERLLKSARRRQAVNYERVLREVETNEGSPE